MPIHFRSPAARALAASLLLIPLPAWAQEKARPPLTILPSEEDWSSFRDPANRRGFLDRIKYLPLGGGGYLTLGGEVRPFYERFTNEVFGAVPGGTDAWLLQRYMLHASLHAHRRVRIFGQLKSTLADGRDGGPRPPDEDRLDLNQLFVDLRVGAIPERGPAPATLRVGRQELSFGSGRMVTVREGPNTRYPWDGVRATIHAAGWRVDGWGTYLVETDRGVFDDSPVEGEKFWGAHGTRPLGVSSVDAYYLGTDKAVMRVYQGAAPETRHTLGARLWSARRPVDFDLEVAGQLGTFGAGAIRAWTVAGSLGHTWQELRVKPRLGIAVGLASGDRDSADVALQTFDPPAPRGTYFGHATPLGPGNIMGGAVQLGFAPLRDVSVGVESYFFWRHTLDDGIYSVVGGPIRGVRGSRARFVAAQPQGEVHWQANRHTRFSISAARAFAGTFLEETGPAEDVDYFSTYLTLKF
ncbi:MAG: hypothetical protein AVDCRST_MAG89-609 [uncultured Gemmatimonadetes bacterium]|uniref:Alginate export domain-containing protein n=1 Tax=uncultured Gemmatimonadota bacterium TaxID=203437 RepID=A0A6J4KF05_9BACT|nr:MAG: hypothetical protein AVDCRST_MAG89-609 [uncultured Gemmatimonadota bacterium]